MAGDLRTGARLQTSAENSSAESTAQILQPGCQPQALGQRYGCVSWKFLRQTFTKRL